MLKRILLLIAVVCLLSSSVFAGAKIVNVGGINGTATSEQYLAGRGHQGINNMTMVNSTQESDIQRGNAYQSTDGTVSTDLDQTIGGGCKKRCGINGYQFAEANICGGGIQVVESAKKSCNPCKKSKGGDDAVLQAGGITLDVKVINDKQGQGNQSAFAGGMGMNTQFIMTPTVMAANTSFVGGGAMAIQSGPGTGWQSSTVAAQAGGATTVNK